ncbi:hypothetical protein [Phocaeicola sp.]|nr:hypothetical protein [Bacteroides sp.]
MENLVLQELTVEEMKSIEGGSWLGKFFLGLGKVFTSIGEWIESVF